MCGRFTLIINELEIEERFSKKLSFRFVPQYNVSPTTPMPIITSDQPLIKSAQWGLPLSRKNKSVVINSRLETLFQQPLFSPLIFSNRCLIPADGFIEWDQSALHQPYYFRFPNQPIFCFAGLYSDQKIAHQWTRFFTIITTNATGEISAIHNRMPLILQPELETQWLINKPLNIEAIKKLETSEPMVSLAISPLINNSKSNNSNYLTPIEKPRTLFDR